MAESTSFGGLISWKFVCIVLVFLPIGNSVKYSSKYKHGDFIDKIAVKSETDAIESRTNFLHSDTRNESLNETLESMKNVDETIENYWPVKIFNCVGSSGVEKCLKIFLVKRMNRIVNSLKGASNVSLQFDLISELKDHFQWEEYKKINDSIINEQIYKNIQKIFSNKKTDIILYPGISVDISPDVNGTMMLNIKKDPELELPRGMKFPKKAFYRLIPMLLIPPLIMAAILPFVLPAMKIIVLWVGLLNQAALAGAVFTLMRNNAFQETHHHKKVIYVNNGYKNEKKPPPSFHHNIYTSIHSRQPFLEPKHPPQEEIKPFPHLTTSGYEEEFDEEADFSDGPVHFSQGNFGHIPHEHDGYDRTSHNFQNYYGKRGNYKG